jgi:hypothetical protein
MSPDVEGEIRYLGGFGPRVRLTGLTLNELPPRKGKGVANATQDASSEPDELLKNFIKDVICEAIEFIDGVCPKYDVTRKRKRGGLSAWREIGSSTGKTYASSETPVYSVQRTVSLEELKEIPQLREKSEKAESWFGRFSFHRDAAEKRTASWDEFVHCFKEHHHETEAAFTDSIIGNREAISWDAKGIETFDQFGGQWTDMSLKIVEMKHKITPKPLKNRTFSVLQLAARLVDAKEFIVVSIPVSDFGQSADSEYAQDPSIVVGAYVSVERIRVLPDDDNTARDNWIEWIMATASDAKGSLPQWMQNLAVPGKILHDVDYFMKWIARERSVNNGQLAYASGSAPVDESSLHTDQHVVVNPSMAMGEEKGKAANSEIVTAPSSDLVDSWRVLEPRDENTSKPDVANANTTTSAMTIDEGEIEKGRANSTVATKSPLGPLEGPHPPLLPASI